MKSHPINDDNKDEINIATDPTLTLVWFELFINKDPKIPRQMMIAARSNQAENPTFPAIPMADINTNTAWKAAPVVAMVSAAMGRTVAIL